MAFLIATAASQIHALILEREFASIQEGLYLTVQGRYNRRDASVLGCATVAVRHAQMQEEVMVMDRCRCDVDCGYARTSTEAGFVLRA